MSPARRFWLIFAAVASLWILGGGVYGAVTWPAAVARVNAEFEASRRDCVSRYPVPARRKRCIDLHEIVRNGNWNQALFERALIAAGPPAFALVVVLLVRIYRRLR
ncbi:MAG: hypothetical protein FJX35_12960 [Alphaproteobacteria bacterium]|nr:hypothetical protein [Alphaproteobacteria bacterium]